jgi:beta-galactosidase
LVKARVLEVSSLRPGLKDVISGAVEGTASRWREHLQVSGADVLARFGDGKAALICAGKQHYLACWPDRSLLASTLSYLTAKIGLKTKSLPDGVRTRRRGPLLFTFNYGNTPWHVDTAGEIVLGSRDLQPQHLTIIRLTEA